METIKVFTGMEVHDTVEMVVLKTLANGVKICWFDFKNDDESESWDELWLAQKNPYSFIDAEWYGIDTLSVQVDLDDYMERKANADYKAEFRR